MVLFKKENISNGIIFCSSNSLAITGVPNFGFVCLNGKGFKQKSFGIEINKKKLQKKNEVYFVYIFVFFCFVFFILFKKFLDFF